MARGSSRASKQASADRSGVADPTASLDSGELLTAARPVLSLLRTDLEARATDPGVTRALEARYEDEKKHKLTGDSFAAWREARIAQIAASWFLSCVFVRTLEDRGLLGQARLAGPGAMDSQAMFFQLAPSLTERDYLLFVFRELAELPASRALFDREHALVWQLSPSAEAAKELLRLFRTPSAETPAFRFGQASTRFLGDLYQDLYEDVRKRFALLQTPDFVERFILDRTLEPAISLFGLDDTTMLDPTCGSGHFLLGAFDRLFEHRLREAPGIDIGQAALLALDAVFGADINPYAIAITRVRLTIAFLEKAGIKKLRHAPALPLHLVVADSLLYNPQLAQLDLEHVDGQAPQSGWRATAFAIEDEAAARDVLHRQYSAVVANPPYITEKDAAKRDAFRGCYAAAYREFSLAAPFVERSFQLARSAGFVGLIVANSFIQREFGKALIEQVLPSLNVELLIDASGVTIPGHGTPTVLIFGTPSAPKDPRVRAVLGKKGVPESLSGELWNEIVRRADQVGYEDENFSVERVDRQLLGKHPWSLSGGGGGQLKTWMDNACSTTLRDLGADVGFFVVTGEDDLLIQGRRAFERAGIPATLLRRLVVGGDLRDWSQFDGRYTIWPYSKQGALLPEAEISPVLKCLWPFRTVLKNRKVFGVPMFKKGLPWWSLREFYEDRVISTAVIAFAFIASNGHFVLGDGSAAFNQAAPVLVLPGRSTDDAQLRSLHGYLNSSAACFWMKKVFYPKYSANQKHNPDPARRKYEYSITQLQTLPVPVLSAEVAILATMLAELGKEQAKCFSGQALIAELEAGAPAEKLRLAIADTFATWESSREAMVALQEELDWVVYGDLGLVDRDVVNIDEVRRTIEARRRVPPGGRPFEMRTGHQQGYTERVGVTAETVDPAVLPAHWIRRQQCLESPENERLRLIESAVHKRTWRISDENTHPDEVRSDLVRTWIAEWLQRRFESQCHRFEGQPLTQSMIADVVGAPALAAASELLGNAAPQQLLAGLLQEISVPHLAAIRLRESGLKKLSEWRDSWHAQRVQEEPSIPPCFAAEDFYSTSVWKLRGPYDFPAETLISYVGLESQQDGQPLYGWAGWDHLQRAHALAALFQTRKREEGWSAERLAPILAGLLELLPWIQQWHNEIDPEYGLRIGDYFAQFLDGELATLGLTKAQLEAWRPIKRANRSKVAAATGEEASGESKASSPKRPRRARQQPSEPPSTASSEASLGAHPVRKPSLPTWGGDILSEVASRTGLGTKAGSWATGLRGESLGTAVLAAVLRQQTEPSSREQVERTVVLALLPRLMQPHFASASRWKSLIGKNDLGIDSVTSLAVPWNAVIRSAIQQKVLIHDSNGRWSAGPDIDDVPASALDARALVALSWIASAPTEDAAVTQELEELRAIA